MIKKTILFIMTTMLSIPVLAQIPEKWVKHSVEDTINVPIEIYWDLSFKLNLEEIGSVGNYDNLPKIVKTIPVKGSFSGMGDSRLVQFDNGKTLLESIIEWQKPGSFTYELTELEIDLKRVARRARGNFRHYPLPGNKTRIVWTYGFDQKNLIFKWLIKAYIKRTHQFWMRDTLAEMKRQTEAMYKDMSNGK